ncbi:replication protein A 70 kDa DNA-binding subunit B [Tanacetum coccineum]
MELIIMDEHATVRIGFINQFRHQLEEGNAVTFQRYSLGENQPKFCMLNKALRLSFLSNTKVETCSDFNGSYHGFAWRPYKSINDLQKEEDGQFDVVGQVGDFAQQLNDFLNTCGDHGRIILVLQLAMMKFWNGKIWGTILYIFDGNECISEDELKEGVPSVIVGTVIAIQEDEGWWYTGCRTCRMKVIKSTDYIDLESKVLKKPTDGPNDWWCRKCQAWVSLIKTQ